MKTSKFLLIFCIFLIFMTSASAEIQKTEATLYNIEFNQVNEKTLVTQIISFDQETSIEIKIPEDARSISSNANYTLGDSIIKFSGRNIEFSYITNENIEKVKAKYYFIDNLIFNFNIKQLNIKLILKEGFIVEQEDIFPKQSTIETDGKRISIVWNLYDLKKGQDLPIFVVFKSTGFEINTLPLIALFTIMIIIILIIYLRKKSIKKQIKPARKIKKREKKLEKIENHLLDSEKKVLNELRKADRNELWQKQLQLKTEFSKAKLSRVIRNLESRNLIQKIPFGNTNKIRLK